MDPFSIITGTVALLGASISTSNCIISFISSMRNIPAELEATSKDVTNFRAVLIELESSIRLEGLLFQSLPQDAPNNLRALAYQLPAASLHARRLIEHAKAKLLEIEGSVMKIRSSEFLAKLRVLERKKLQDMRQELRDMKISISAHFSVKSGRLSLQSLVSLQNISRFVVQASRDNAHQNNLLGEIHQYMRHTQDLQDEQRRISDLVNLLNSQMQNCHISQIPTSERYLEGSSNDGSQSPSFSPLQSTATSSGNETLAVSNVESTTESVSTAIVRDSSSLANTYYNTVFKLDISRFRKQACKPFCSCVCHRRYRRRTSNRLVGSLAIGYSRLLFFNPACTEKSCTNPTSFSATVTYFFPTWLFMRVISLIFVTSVFGDPFVGIKIRPMTQAFSIFRHAAAGNLDGLKSLFSRNEVHPSSSFLGGWTALHYAISNGQAAVCKLLLSEKADPLIEDGGNSQSALEWAWCKILGKSFEPDCLQEFETIFSDRECLEEFGFSEIHRLVLGLKSENLESLLESVDAETINYQDFGGRTALSWAAQRGQFQTVAELLEHGADPNIVTPTGMAPLHYACGALNPTCISPLLAYGADINAIDHGGHNSLHFATQHRDDVAYLVPLLEAGISIDAKTNYGFTPLIDTVGKDNVASATYLLNHGANVNERGQYGKTPIMYAIEYNSHSCLRLLLARGADHRIECSAGPTIAHFAAYDADLDTLQILIEAQLKPLPLHSLEMEGYGELTIEEIITKRLKEEESLDETFTTTFNQFINSIVSPQDPDNISNSTERTEEVWEDALEHQSEEVDSV